MNFEYIIALTVMLALYAAGIYLIKYIRNVRLFNVIFTCAVYIPYLLLCFIVYEDVGFYDWNFQNVLPVANVSPFMFSILPLILLMPKKIREHFYLLISLLTVGMLLSSVFGCIYNASINYRFHFHFMLDYVAHLILSLFGIYLIKSKQAKPTVKSCAISAGIILSVATLMLILNLILDTSFFGLSLRGKHNIYNNVLTDSSLLSALLYYIGLSVVLLSGVVISKIFSGRGEK